MSAASSVRTIEDSTSYRMDEVCTSVSFSLEDAIREYLDRIIQSAISSRVKKYHITIRIPAALEESEARSMIFSALADLLGKSVQRNEEKYFIVRRGERQVYVTCRLLPNGNDGITLTLYNE